MSAKETFFFVILSNLLCIATAIGVLSCADYHGPKKAYGSYKFLVSIGAYGQQTDFYTSEVDLNFLKQQVITINGKTYINAPIMIHPNPFYSGQGGK